jgi:hypothetical protein
MNANSHVAASGAPDASAPAGDRRPESVRILGLVAMTLGLVGLFGLLGRLAFESKGWWARGEAEDPLGYWPLVTSLAGAALSALLFAGGRAAFHVKPRATPMLRAYAVGALLVGAAGLFLYLRQLAQSRDRGGWQFAWGGYGTLFEVLFWPAAMALGVAALVLLSRPRVRAALAAGGRAPGAGPL